MQSTPVLLAEFEETFAAIRDGQEVPRPTAFGYTRLARQVHKVEEITTRLYQVMARNPRYPLPKEPETLYERWLEADEDDEFDDLMGAIYRSNPHVFKVN